MKTLRFLPPLAALGTVLAGCGGLMDNAPVSTQVYLAAAPTDLGACGEIEVSGNITQFASDWQPAQGVHLAPAQDDYAQTPWTSDEVRPGTPATVVLKRPGTYTYAVSSLFRYDWTLRLVCRNTGRITTFSQSGTFKDPHRTAVLRITASGANLIEFRNGTPPAQMNLP